MCMLCPEGAESNAASASSRPHAARDADPALIGDLVAANRILFHQGVVDGFGHVSVRHNKRPRNFLLSRNMAPANVTAADILEYDPEGEPVVAGGPRVYLERFIHSEIYKARPDVVAVVHSHSPSVVPFGVVTGVPLRAVCHMSSFLGLDTPIFEIRDTAGPANDMLIRDKKLGAALATSLGDRPAVLMRGHGSTVVGSTLRQAVFRAIYTEVNAKLQAEALRLGPVTYLNAQEAELSAATNATQIDRAWDLWKSLASASGA
jgi:ribulose-5-phosphate 4-epimerase/fuculose-1-phosphate aldolase